MKTLKELQAQIEELQQEKNTLTALCEFVPKKLAIFFKEIYLSSGYSMREKIVYSCNGKELLVIDNRESYTGRGRKYTPTHGFINVDFTKKSLKQYLSVLKEIDRLEWFNKLSKNKHRSIQQELNFMKAHNRKTLELEEELVKVQDVINERNNELIEKGGELKRLVLMNINYQESKIKDLVCTGF